MVLIQFYSSGADVFAVEDEYRDEEKKGRNTGNRVQGTGLSGERFAFPLKPNRRA